MRSRSAIPLFIRRAVALCFAVGLAGCIEDADILLEPDPPEPIDAGIDSALAAPRIVVEPESLLFSAPGERQPLTVTNEGDGPLVLAHIRRVGAAGFAVTGQGQNALVGPRPLRVLAPGESAMFEVEALAPPPAAATLVFESDDPARGEVRVAVGYSGVPCLQAMPAAIDFGEVAPGSVDEAGVALSNCGDEPIEVRSMRFDDGAAGFALGVPFGVPLVLGAGEAVRLSVWFRPMVAGPARDTLRVEAVGAAVAVPIGGRGEAARCPVAVPVAPLRVAALSVVALDAATVLAGERGEGATYEWVVVQRPDGSVAQVVERFLDPAQPDNGGESGDPATPVDWFFVDLVGRYVFELRYRDLAGCEVIATLALDACPCDDEGFAIEVDWHTPGDPLAGEGADIDLHLLHPNAEGWSSAPYDCYFAEPTPDWGQIGNAIDDPALSGDVVGRGPERIILRYPENTRVLGRGYFVGAHYYTYEAASSPAAPVPVAVTLRVWMRGEPVAEWSRELGPGEFWHAAALFWPAGQVGRVDRVMPWP